MNPHVARAYARLVAALSAMQPTPEALQEVSDAYMAYVEARCGVARRWWQWWIGGCNGH